MTAGSSGPVPGDEQVRTMRLVLIISRMSLHIKHMYFKNIFLIERQTLRMKKKMPSGFSMLFASRL